MRRAPAAPIASRTGDENADEGGGGGGDSGSAAGRSTRDGDGGGAAVVDSFAGVRPGDGLRSLLSLVELPLGRPEEEAGSADGAGELLPQLLCDGVNDRGSDGGDDDVPRHTAWCDRLAASLDIATWMLRRGYLPADALLRCDDDDDPGAKSRAPRPRATALRARRRRQAVHSPPSGTAATRAPLIWRRRRACAACGGPARSSLVASSRSCWRC
jgi:hypothetical protein